MTHRAELLQRLRDTLADRRATRTTLRDALQAAHDHLASSRAGRPRTPPDAVESIQRLKAARPDATVDEISTETGVPRATVWRVLRRGE